MPATLQEEKSEAGSVLAASPRDPDRGQERSPEVEPASSMIGRLVGPQRAEPGDRRDENDRGTDGDGERHAGPARRKRRAAYAAGENLRGTLETLRAPPGAQAMSIATPGQAALARFDR